MRLVLRDLRAATVKSPPDAKVYFGFDGQILRIEPPTGVIGLAGTGPAWPFRISVVVASLDALPNRLMHPAISLSFWDGRLEIGSRRFPAEQEGTE